MKALKWKPRINQKYWYVSFITVSLTQWHGSVFDNIHYNGYNCFKTRELAQQCLDKIIKIKQEAQKK